MDSLQREWMRDYLSGGEKYEEMKSVGFDLSKLVDKYSDIYTLTFFGLDIGK